MHFALKSFFKFEDDISISDGQGISAIWVWTWSYRINHSPFVIDYYDRTSEIIESIKKRGLRSQDLRALQPYLVNLREREFEQTEALREQIAEGVWLWQGTYNQIKGIAIGKEPILYDPADLFF